MRLQTKGKNQYEYFKETWTKTGHAVTLSAGNEKTMKLSAQPSFMKPEKVPVICILGLLTQSSRQKWLTTYIVVQRVTAVVLQFELAVVEQIVDDNSTATLTWASNQIQEVGGVPQFCSCRNQSLAMISEWLWTHGTQLSNCPSCWERADHGRYPAVSERLNCWQG